MNRMNRGNSNDYQQQNNNGYPDYGQQPYPYTNQQQPYPYYNTQQQQGWDGQQNQGYAQQPYGQQQPYQQNPYAQYDQNPQSNPYSQQQYNPNYGYQQQPWQQQYDPQNGYQQQGGGYPLQVDGMPQQAQPVPPVPENVRPPREPIDMDRLTRTIVLVSLPILLVLFIVGMVLSSVLWVKWIFVAIALMDVALMWTRPLLLQSDVRLTLTCVIGALTLVTLVSAITTTAADVRSNQTQTAAATPSPGVQTMQVGGYTAPETEDQETESLSEWVEVTVAPTEAVVTDSGLASAAVQQMESFLYFWTVNDIDSMVNLCSPSWCSAQDAPKTALFSILANRTPTDYEATSITGTDNDSTRTVTTTISLHRNNGSDPLKYIFKVVMVNENGTWYVDPRSLESNEKATATPASAEITQPPTPAPVADDNVVLYYNPNGGTQYHLDQNCKSANAKYLPFKGTFTYGQINDSPYADLIPCSVCGAPLRPDT